MSFPGEELIATTFEKVVDSAIHKMDQAEARRDREFSYKLKELEFYKGNYDKEIRSIFDDWFNLLQNSLLAKRKDITEEQRKKYEKALNESLKPDTAVKLKIKTIKYGGTETGKALALFSQISYEQQEERPFFSSVYVICFLLSTLKREILGQTIEPITILQILLTDYFEKLDVINEARAYVEEKYRTMFASDDE
jgi:hypothetical protein